GRAVLGPPEGPVAPRRKGGHRHVHPAPRPRGPSGRGGAGLTRVSAPEVGGLELRVLPELLARSAHGHAAGLKDVGLAADLEGEVGVLLHKEDRYLLVAVD